MAKYRIKKLAPLKVNEKPIPREFFEIDPKYAYEEKIRNLEGKLRAVKTIIDNG